VRPDISHALFALTTAGFALLLIQNALAILPNRPWWVFFMPFFGAMLGISMAVFFLIATKWYLGTHLILPVIGIGFGIAFAISHVREYVFTPLRTYSGLPNVWDRWKARFARDRGKPASNAIEGLLDFDRSGRMWGWYLFLLVLGFCSALAHAAGSFSARTTFEFAFRAGPSPCIVIRRYGDNLICAGIDTTHNAVLDSFSVLSVSDSLTFSNRVFGALKFPEDQKKGHLFGSP
jgi:hypothetical protein